MDTRNVQIIFEEETAKGMYRDSLYIPLDKYETTTDTEIEAMKQKRVEAFLQVVEQLPVEPTKEDYEAQLAGLEQQIEQLRQTMRDLGYLDEVSDGN